MGYSKVTLYTKKNLGKTGRSFYLPFMDSERENWNNFIPLIRFFQNYCDEENWNNSIKDGVELTPRLIKTFNKKLLSLPKAMKENGVEDGYFDTYNPYHRNFYQKLGKLFFFRDEDYNDYMEEFKWMKGKINFFSELVKNIEYFEENNIPFVVTLKTI